MHKFRDSTGREWRIAFNGLSLKTLRDDAAVDIGDSESFWGAVTDDARFVEVLEVLCRQQLDESGLSVNAFWEAMDGDSLYQAAEAMRLEWLDFFRRRSPQKAAIIDEAWKHSEKLEQQMATMTKDMLRSDKIDVAMTEKLKQAETILEAQIAQIFGEPSTN